MKNKFGVNGSRRIKHQSVGLVSGIVEIINTDFLGNFVTDSLIFIG